jgi:AraC family transcriptional regulator
MSSAIRIMQGAFGRVALLDMNQPLVTHAHHHCHVLLKVDGPDTTFRVREVDCPLTEASAVLVNAWEPHAYTHHPPGVPDTVILALYVEPGWLAHIQRQLCVSSHPRFFPQPCVELPARVRGLADHLAMEMLYSDHIPADRLESALFELMIAVIDSCSDWRSMRSSPYWREAGSLHADARIRRAIAAMRENLREEVNVDVLAARQGLSRAHFFELFRRATHLTPRLYANVLRMEAAIEALGAPRRPVAEVADRLGFSAPSHFTRFFRRHLGVTPSEYQHKVQVFEHRAPRPLEM